MINQKIITSKNNYEELDTILVSSSIHCLLLICDGSISFLEINKYFNDLESLFGVKVVRFSKFKPNPSYDSVCLGIEELKKNNCDAIIAVGGGSAIDVAKSIKLFSNMDSSINYLKQDIVPNSLPLFAVPTTAGTGSEATRYAAIYFEGEKQSVTDESCIPSVVLMDPTVLKTLPLYQKKATMLDALCHSIESFWSVNATEESREYSKKALSLILENYEAYFDNEEQGNANMLLAANYAGKAINISQTTAGHAMCYKLTTLYGIAHGHAAALCIYRLWPYMENVADDSLKPLFIELSNLISVEKFQNIVDGLALDIPKASEEDIDILTHSVNPTRLKNNPIQFDEKTIEELYRSILN